VLDEPARLEVGPDTTDLADGQAAIVLPLVVAAEQPQLAVLRGGES